MILSIFEPASRPLMVRGLRASSDNLSDLLECATRADKGHRKYKKLPSSLSARNGSLSDTVPGMSPVERVSKYSRQKNHTVPQDLTPGQGR